MTGGIAGVEGELVWGGVVAFIDGFSEVVVGVFCGASYREGVCGYCLLEGGGLVSDADPPKRG